MFQAAAAAVWMKRRFIRYEISGDSMLPALAPGDFVVVDTFWRSSWQPASGEIVLARDPREEQRTLVKRVELVEVEGACWLLGDNAPHSTDSRTFGAISRQDIIGRVRWRYWPAPGRIPARS
jgi:nickel-type superoxide dismutase maturation protease